MLLIDSDIIIDGARGEAQAKEFLGKNATNHVSAISTMTRLELPRRMPEFTRMDFDPSDDTPIFRT